MTSSFSFKRILFAAAALFLFFFFQQQIPIWSSDEGRFSEVAREMWETKNFVIPHFNYVAFLDKPILAPLFTSAGYALFGVNEVTSRLVPILAALAGLIFLYRFALRIWGEKTADYSVLLLLTTLGYVLVGRFAVIDMLMTFFLSVSLYCMFIAFWEKKRVYYLAAYATMGLGFLTKGLIGIVLPAGIFFMFLLWSRNLKELLKMHIPFGILILLAIVLPWFIAAMKQKSDFFDVFIVKQHFHRFATSTFGRKRPLWFFIPILFALGAPWSLFMPSAVLQGFKSTPQERTRTQFLVCWILGILIFFSIPKSKLPYYILPVTVPLALLVGNFFARVTEDKNLKLPVFLTHGIWKLLAGVSCLGAIGLNIYLSFFAHKPEILALKNFALMTTLLLAAGFVTAYLKQRAYGFSKGVFYLAATIYLGLLLTACGMKIISPIQSSYDEAQIIRSEFKEGDLTAVYGSPDRFSDLPFHLKQRIAIAGADWGTLKDQTPLLPAAEQAEYFYDTSAFVSFFNTKTRRIFCLTEEDRLSELQNEGLKTFRTLSQGRGKILISNF